MFHEERQRHTDEERGRADLRERFHSGDWGRYLAQIIKADSPVPIPNESFFGQLDAQDAAEEAHEHQLYLIAGREIAQQMKEEGKL